jgi:hypothetical protein
MEKSRKRAREGSWRARGPWIIGGLLAALASALVWPLLPILAGTALLVLIGLHLGVPGLRAALQPILRAPVGSASARLAHLVLLVSAAVLLLGVGAVSSTTRGHVRSRWEQEQRAREAAQRGAQGVLERAREHLDRGEVHLAELVLMEVDGLGSVDASLRAEIEALLERVRASGDARAVLQILVGLPREEFEAFAAGRSLPAALEHPERALSMRAAQTARSQLEQARRLRPKG